MTPTPMDLALEAARAAAARGEVPVGAVVTGPDGAVLAVAGNQVEADCDAAGARRITGAAGGGAQYWARRG